MSDNSKENIVKSSLSSSLKDNVPELRFSEFSSNWNRSTIGKQSENIFVGGTPSTKNNTYWSDGDIKWMSSGEINKRSLYDTDKYISHEGYKESSTKLVKPQSVLMALAGQGKTRGMVAVNEVELCTNQSIASIEVNSEYIDYKFLYYNLLNRYKRIRLISSTGDGRGGINLKMIKEFTLAVPSIIEQKKISLMISKIDRLIESYNSKIENLKLLKKGRLQNMFSQNRNNEIKNIGELILESKNRSVINNEFPILTSSKSGIFLQSEYFKNTVASDNNIGYKIVKSGQFTYRSMSDTGFFKFNVLEKLVQGIISPAYPVFDVKGANKLYFYYLINNDPYIKQQLLSLKEGGTRLALSISKLKKLNIKLHSEIVQKKYSNELELIDKLLIAYRMKLFSHMNLKNYLLNKMFV